jgi:hypothetical protein
LEDVYLALFAGDSQVDVVEVLFLCHLLLSLQGLEGGDGSEGALSALSVQRLVDHLVLLIFLEIFLL